MDLNNYKKDYIIVASDRIIFNSKDDSIIFSAKKFHVVSAIEGIHFNIGDDVFKNGRFVVNSPKIEFGLDTKGSLQPIAKGDETVFIFNQILNALSNFCSTMEKAKGIGTGLVDLPLVTAAANKLNGDLSLIKRDLSRIKSTTTYSI